VPYLARPLRGEVLALREHAARRLGWALLTALVASIAAFAMFWAIPNVDPEYWLGGAEKGNDATRTLAIEQYGLDDPLPVQYTRLMDSILSGDVACFYGCGNLRDAFLEALPVTLSLVIGAALIAIVAGVGLALVCVRHLGRWQDRLITTVATAAYSVPTLVLAALLWGFLTYRWNVFPQAATCRSPRTQSSGSGTCCCHGSRPPFRSQAPTCSSCGRRCFRRWTRSGSGRRARRAGRRSACSAATCCGTG
jgi:ABC-type dipeptide/oligopeptide/nickel transport system permease component